MIARCWIAVAILGLLPMAARAQEEVNVTGRVVDAAGKPVAGADVAPHWGAPNGKMIPFQGTTTNAEGRFTLAIVLRPRKQKLMAMTKDRKTGGLVSLEEKSAGKPVEIKLASLVRLHGRISFKELEQRPSFATMMLFSESFFLCRCVSRDASFSFHLPPGDYRLGCYAPGCEDVAKEISLKPDVPDLDFGTIDIPASFITRHKGKTLPAWHVTDTRGIAKDVKLSDFKGKWVLLEFWGYW